MHDCETFPFAGLWFKHLQRLSAVGPVGHHDESWPPYDERTPSFNHAEHAKIVRYEVNVGWRWKVDIWRGRELILRTCNYDYSVECVDTPSHILMTILSPLTHLRENVMVFLAFAIAMHYESSPSSSSKNAKCTAADRAKVESVKTHREKESKLRQK